ncbi:MoaD/ThiS family protein [Acidaminobacter hydrogenoformans]|uniref:Mut7-C ubiquitin n=1 Tax=Acidaminobacter hydrogenoformans DSM 2784 TaxID=1120920 RepID=A0A1G5RXN6_9FIRM|nr:MoaD/ThiS family protein [Acidaminobacter hydrogenoformans]SCZ78803.1 Mut7-C ubiquitin [Acidaminobacter hydrogenoformans DSM 2784]
MSKELHKQLTEIRGFLHLDAFLRKKHGSIPVMYEMAEPMTGFELAEKLDIKLHEIEVIFINGFVHALDTLIHPGDRVAFLPPGCPGPYRVALGFYGKNQDNAANFKIKKED